MRKISTEQRVDETIRVFIRDVPGLPADEQRRLIRKAVGLGVEYVAGKDASQRDLWAKQARGPRPGYPGDRCIVARLSLIAEPRRKGGRAPTVDSAAVITGLMARGCIIVDVLGGVTSQDNGKFSKRVEDETNVVRSGRRLGTSEARKRGKKGAENRWGNIRTVNAWELPELATLKAELMVIWKSRVHKNDDQAAAAINARLLDMGHAPMGSTSTVRRVMKHRT